MDILCRSGENIVDLVDTKAVKILEKFKKVQAANELDT